MDEASVAVDRTVKENSGLAVMKGECVLARDWVAGGLRVRPLAVGRPVGDSVGATVREPSEVAESSMDRDCSAEALPWMLGVA